MTSAPRPDALAEESRSDATQRPPAIIERMLAERQAQSLDQGTLRQTAVVAWQDRRGTLTGGIPATAAASCLLRPATGDMVLAWCPDSGRTAHIVAVLVRAADTDAPAVLASESALAVQAPSFRVEAQSVSISGEIVQIGCEDLLTHAKNAHAVEGTRTESARVRVAQIGTDIRRATTVDDEVKGTLLQRTGTWISNTAREARFKARSFLYD